MARLIKRVAAKRDLTDHFVFLAENASVNVARRQLQFTIHPSPFIMLPWTTERSSPSNPANEVESRAFEGCASPSTTVLSYLASGMTHQEILTDFPYLTEDDILACLSYAADREHHLMVSRE